MMTNVNLCPQDISARGIDLGSNQFQDLLRRVGEVV